MEDFETIKVINDYLEESLRCMEEIANGPRVLDDLLHAAKICIDSLNEGGKIMFMGNGGSAADSQHLATELVSRYNTERAAIPALSLTVDSSAITAIANDYNFDVVFSRQIEALAKEGDVAIGITTSGNSANVIKGIEMAKKLGCKTICFTGKDGGEVAKRSEHIIKAPSNETPIIQQAHITFGHTICDIIERSVESKNDSKKS